MDVHADPSYYFITDPHPSSTRIACVSPADIRVLECDDSDSPFHTVAAFPHAFPLSSLAWSPDPNKLSFFAGAVVSTGRTWLFQLDLSLHASLPIPSYRNPKSSHKSHSSIARALHRASQKSRQRLYASSPDDVDDALDDTDIETDNQEHLDNIPPSRSALGSKSPPVERDSKYNSPEPEVDAIDIVFEDSPFEHNIPQHSPHPPPLTHQSKDTSDQFQSAVYLDPRSSRPLNSLAFDPIQPNILATAYAKARDHGLYFWDITKPSNPLVSFAYGDTIQSLAFVPPSGSATSSPSSSLLLAGVGSKSIRAFDRRASSAASQLTFSTTANSGIVSDPFQPFQIVSYSSTECTVKLWDIRKPSYSLTTFITNTAPSNSPPIPFSSSISKSLPSRSLTFSPSTMAHTIGRSTLKSRSGGRSGTSLAENIMLNAAPRSDSPPNPTQSASSLFIEEVKFSPKTKGLLGVLHRGSSAVQLWHYTNAANDTPWLLSQTCSPSFSQPISSFEFSPPDVPSSSLHQIYGLFPSPSYPFSQDYLKTHSHHEIHPLEDLHPRNNPPHIEIVRNNGAAQLSWLKGAAFATSFGNPDTLRIMSPKVSKTLKRAFQMDIAVVMEKRLLSHGYSIDPSINATATNDSQLCAFWSWIVHAQDLARDGKSQIGGFNFAFKGIKDILNGFSPSTPAENRRQSRMISHRGFLDPRSMSDPLITEAHDTDLSKIPISSADLLEGLKDSLYKSDLKAAQEEEFCLATGRFLQGTIVAQEKQGKKQQVHNNSIPSKAFASKNRGSNKLSSRPHSSELPDLKSDELVSSMDEVNLSPNEHSQSTSNPVTANVSPSASRSTSQSRAETPIPTVVKPLGVSKTYPPDPIRTSVESRGRGHASTIISMSTLPPSSTATTAIETYSTSSAPAPSLPSTDAKRLLSSENTRAGPSKSSPTGTITAFQQKSVAKNQQIYANVVGGSCSMMTRRRAALVTLGPDFARDDASIIQECANRGEIERATAWALWTDRTEDAISILRSSKNHDLMLLAPVLAGYLLQKNQQANSLLRHSSERSDTSATDIESEQGGEKSNTTNSSSGHETKSDGRGGSSSPALSQVTRHGVEYRELCSALGTELEDPFLRASFVYMANSDWHDVLEEMGLPLRDRLAVAIKYLEDDQLFRFMDSVTSKVIAAGELEAVVVTGLVGESGESLLQNYLDRTTDIQTVALASSFPPETEFFGMVHGHGEVRTRERWANAYRSLLDDWHQFGERVRFDQWRAKRQFSSATRVPDNMGGVIIRCRYCDGPAHITSNIPPFELIRRSGGVSSSGPGVMDVTSATGAGTGAIPNPSSRAQSGVWNNKGTCKRCGQGLPRCAVCLERLDIGGGDSDGTIASSSSSSVWMWCQYCRHGGHSNHLAEWFNHSSICAVAGCDCVCR